MVRFCALLCLIALFSAAFTSPDPGKKFKAPKAFVFVPSGTYTDAQQHYAVQGFYMMSREVTNLDYMEFLHYMKAKGQEADYEKARVRPEGWDIWGFDNEKARKYNESPAYHEYPVVNITQEAARMYCQWMTGLLQDKHPDFKIEARLPTEKEWMYAAQGGIPSACYPHGRYLRNRRGEYLYVFRVLGDESIHQDPSTGELTIRPNSRPIGPIKEGLFGPMPSTFSTPNAYGLFNTSGNVAEMLQEEGRTKGGSFRNTGFDIRIDAPDPYAGFKEASPCIGFRVLLTVVAR